MTTPKDPLQPEALTVATASPSQLSRSSEASRPEAPPQWLEPVMQRTVRGIEALVSSIGSIASRLDDYNDKVDGQIEATERRHLARTTDLQAEFSTLRQEMRDTVEAFKQFAVAMSEARQAQIAATEELGAATEGVVQATKDLTGSHKLQGYQIPRDGMPELFHRLGDWAWPVAKRHGPAAYRYAAHAITGSGVLAAIAKLIHFVATHS